MFLTVMSREKEVLCWRFILTERGRRFTLQRHRREYICIVTYGDEHNEIVMLEQAVTEKEMVVTEKKNGVVTELKNELITEKEYK